MIVFQLFNHYVIEDFLYFLLFASSTVSAQLHHQMLSSQGSTSKTNNGVIVTQTIGQQSITDFIVRSNACIPTIVNVNYNTSAAIGSGMSNSTSIGSDWSSGTLLCLNLVYQGYDDWFLPSRDELVLAFQNIPSFSGQYWSSTQAADPAAPFPTLSMYFVNDNGFEGNYSTGCVADIKAVWVFN